ncbi:carbohydrate-binding protein [Streptomyces chattanoogensis]|uniref:Carbohydrate-binding protein n=1 Tax=Streptomyces chattanoogensis TaxID=66876 RepID=A0A0N0XZ57_9ACTN|nr:carbohydrate-binding protein [Streptomyces chattanoogensis]KPC66278.1 carbohydrate-binding protein [Streptomyces chattanoogensis]
MTAGNNGADTPENDDPFGYLYRSEGGDGGAPGSAAGGPARQPGVPRTSYNQVRAVGERQYGGQQNAHYAAPETLPGGERTRSVPAQGYDQEPRRSRNGLLIGAVAVVAVVCIGIGVAMLTNGNKDSDDTANKPGPAAGDSVAPSKEPDAKPTPAELPKQDAGSLRLDGGATTAKDIPGARSANGTYVAGMNTPGASATWTVDVDKKGTYKLYVDYGVPGKDANLTLTVNSKVDPRPISLKNFAHAPEGAWDKGWTESWSLVQLNAGTNTIKMSCESGNQCDVNLEKVWLADKGKK